MKRGARDAKVITHHVVDTARGEKVLFWQTGGRWATEEEEKLAEAVDGSLEKVVGMVVLDIAN